MTEPPTEIRAPTVDGFTRFTVESVWVGAGAAEVAKDDPLVDLDSPDATFYIQAPCAASVVSVDVAPGDAVQEDSLLVTLRVHANQPAVEVERTVDSESTDAYWLRQSGLPWRQRESPWWFGVALPTIVLALVGAALAATIALGLVEAVF